jgi:hypothetical protein
MAEEPRNGRAGVDVAEETRRRFAEEMRHAAQQGEKLTGGAGLPGERREDDQPRDWPEVWGPRVGRALGYAFALYLLWHLLSTYVLKG